jgi:hypothetical protein
VPIHDWTCVDAGLFHAFHQSWIVKLCDALNDEEASGNTARGFARERVTSPLIPSQIGPR